MPCQHECYFGIINSIAYENDIYFIDFLFLWKQFVAGVHSSNSPAENPNKLNPDVVADDYTPFTTFLVDEPYSLYLEVEKFIDQTGEKVYVQLGEFVYGFISTNSDDCKGEYRDVHIENKCAKFYNADHNTNNRGLLADLFKKKYKSITMKLSHFQKRYLDSDPKNKMIIKPKTIRNNVRTARRKIFMATPKKWCKIDVWI